MNAIDTVMSYFKERYGADLYQKVSRREIARERSITAEESQQISEKAFEMVRSACEKYWSAPTNFEEHIFLAWPSAFDLDKYSKWAVEEKSDYIIVSVTGPDLTTDCRHFYYLKYTESGYKIFRYETSV